MPTNYTISGTIYDVDSTPLSDALVEVFELGLRKSVRVGSAVTDSIGAYKISFEEADAKEYKSPDVRLSISKRGQATEESPIYFNIIEETVIDYRLGGKAILAINEFDRLVALLAPIVKDSGLTFADLSETKNDFSFLAGETGESENSILCLAAAYRFELKSPVDVRAYFALMMGGFPKDLTALFAIKTELVKTTLEAAIVRNIVSLALRKQIPSIVKKINSNSNEEVVNGMGARAVKFRQIAGLTLDSRQQAKLVKTLFENEQKIEDDPENFWRILSRKPSFRTGRLAEKTRKLFELNQLLGGQTEMTNLIFKRLSEQENGSDLRTFAYKSAPDWEEDIKESRVVDFPLDVNGETPEEKTRNYAALLETQFKEAFPTAFFRGRLEADTSSTLNREVLVKFIDRNPNFSFTSANFLNDLERSDFRGIADPTKIKDSLKTINRLQKLVGNDYSAINALHAKNLHSAAKVVNTRSKNSFKTEFTIALGGEQKAGQAYEKALSVYNRSMAMLVADRTTNNLNLAVINASVDASASGNAANQQPGYSNLFDDGDLCSCQDCQSLYSPAAYFVDVLAFLKRENLAYNSLTDTRRADLGDIKLTCENTNTALPYIDLVNELLEKQVISGSDPSKSCQTTWQANELKAWPEHSDPEAYKKMKALEPAMHFTIQLPYDDEFEQIRLYSEKAGWKGYDLLLSLSRLKGFPFGNGANSTDDFSRLKLAKAWFGISNAVWDTIIASPGVQPPADNKVRSVLRLMNLEYFELQNLLQSYYLNPPNGGSRTITITLPATEKEICNLDALEVSGISAEWLSKAVTFLRLSKATGRNIFDLDRALMAWAKSAVDNEVLVRLFELDQLGNLLKFNFAEALAFTAPLDNFNYITYAKEGEKQNQSLYYQLFEQKGMPGLKEGSMEAKKPVIAGSMGTTVAELDILGFLQGTSQPMEILGFYFRYVMLAKKLGLDVSQLKKLLELTGQQIGPFQLFLDFDGIVKVIETAAKLATLQIKPTELADQLKKKDSEILSSEISVTLVAYLESTVSKLSKLKIQLESLTDAEMPVPEVIIEKKKEQIKKAFKKFRKDLPKKGIWFSNATLPKGTHDRILVMKLAEKFLNSIIEDQNWDVVLQRIKLLTKIVKEFRSYPVENEDFLPSILGRLGFNPVVVNWLFTKRSELGIEFLFSNSIQATNTLLYEIFHLLFYLSKLNQFKTPEDKDNWTTIFDLLFDSNISKPKFYDLLVGLYGISENNLKILCSESDQIDVKVLINLKFPAAYPKQETLVLLINTCAQLDKLAASETQLKALLGIGLDPAEGSPGTVVFNFLKSKYPPDAWLEEIALVSDTLREKRRDALTAWLIASPNNGWQLKNDIYKYLLIDTEMDACMETSRIKQAISSVQLFINRCLMGLEPGVTVDDDFAKQWNSWRKMYRIWEANRKIFLYPENWVEPELRDDKSPFFDDLESELKQNEVTDETATEALITYLRKLDTVSKLEIMGLFDDKDSGKLHVIGRTASIPHQYYYRYQHKDMWSAWEKIEVDVEGDHLLPVVWNGRLILFWGQFTEKQEQSSANSSITGSLSNKDQENVSEANLSLSSAEPVKYYDMKLAWTEYRNGGWSGKKMSKQVMKISGGALLPIDRYSLSSSFKQEELRIGTYLKNGGGVSGEYASEYILTKSTSPNSFYFTSCNTDRLINNLNPDYFCSHNNRNNKLDFEDRLGLTLYSTHSFFSPKYSNLGPTQFTILKEVENSNYISTVRHDLDKSALPIFFLGGSEILFFAKGQKSTLVIPDILSTLPRRDTTAAVLFDTPVQRGDSSERELLLRAGVPLNTSVQNGDTSEKRFGVFFTTTKYKFSNHFHSSVCSFIKTINTKGVDSLYQPQKENVSSEDIFKDKYKPSLSVLKPYPKIGELEFDARGSYSLYNWEVFYHIPITIASQLMVNQKFDQARKWLHFIFDPTQAGNVSDGLKRFWIMRPFRDWADSPLSLTDLLQDEAQAANLSAQLDYWEEHPFNPHAVARLRISAYMRKTVLLYLDNLIKWGDQLFARDTIESINEATLLYVLAEEILGDRPQVIPSPVKTPSRTFNDIAESLNDFSNADIEVLIPYGSGGTENQVPVPVPYFCLPSNKEILKYWDTVGDRLFKIRNCMNIAGTVRSLALFEPPIDPAMLVRAAEAGISLSQMLDESVSLPYYRFQIVLQKANEFCNDVKNLGSMMLAAIEKKDAEGLSLLRSTHELSMLDAVKLIKERQRDEAKENLNGLERSRVVVEERYSYYSSREFMSIWEALYFQSSYLGLGFQAASAEAKALAATINIIPDIKMGSGFTIGITSGGSNLGAGADAAADTLSAISFLNNAAGLISNTLAGYKRRKEDWDFQARTAELELRQIEKQVIAAEIRVAIAEQDLENHNLQREQSREVDAYMRSKFSNTELYKWIIKELTSLYNQCYQLAYKMARRAEMCMRHELGVQNTEYIRFGYWDNLKQGLLSGERLQFDLRRLEDAYMNENVREFELTKHISLALIDPWALQQLKVEGKCDFKLNETLFDLDFPGHYFRRIKAVSISIPCIAGPYTSVNATLRLLSNTVRINPSITGGAYEKVGSNDNRFNTNNISCKAIATSNAQNDSGMFELNFRDERYLPFEYAGAESDWQLELSGKSKDGNKVIDFSSFDFQTISDVIIHLRYTSRDGGDILKDQVYKHLNSRLFTTQQEPLQLFDKVISLKNDFPNAWFELQSSAKTSFMLGAKDFPFISRKKSIKVTKTIEAYSTTNVTEPLDATEGFSIEMNSLDFPAKDGTKISVNNSNEANVSYDDLILKFSYKVS
ncbi:neuraminidase-like domain-containing protein [Dyadobacter sp. CY347]|uniref:Tc toxin subunit A-related protein n=1 Tax=Dyadobacter sp. CY347 TaxID=2909336 RepID=UPI001EEB0613|nr:neuraminidase-like domain-containing protein [Dyadobacter sp. CY347]MCF2490253.1 Tc toxin subunit A [Dyadobacter sp. CY347]